MNHTNCDHPATKAGRALCRKIRKAQDDALKLEARTLIDSYYDGTGDFEEIIQRLIQILPIDLRNAYFDSDTSPDELISLANLLRLS